MRKNSINLAAVFVFSMCMICARAQTATNLIGAVESDDYGIRKHATEQMKQRRFETITNLISILNGDFSADVKTSAAVVLGNYRAPEAVNALATNIYLDYRGRLIGLVPEEEAEPICTAFEKIGSPSIPTIINLLKEFDDKEINEMEKNKCRNRLLRSLYRIEGDKGIVQLRLQKALATEKDSEHQARLQSAIQKLAETWIEN